MPGGDLYNRLRDLLEREHQALISGQIDTLARLCAEKERLIGALQTTAAQADLGTLQALRPLAERNAHLLQALRRGVSAARESLDRIRNGSPLFGTYDSKGTSTPLVHRSGAVERRA